MSADTKKPDILKTEAAMSQFTARLKPGFSIAQQWVLLCVIGDHRSARFFQVPSRADNTTARIYNMARHTQHHYVRQQTAHSITKHLLLGRIVCFIPTIYYAISPNHYLKL